MKQKPWSDLRIDKTGLYDAVVFGSAVRGESASDLDVALILKKDEPLAARLERARQYKELHVIVVTLRDLEDPGFVARQGIIAEGISLFTGEPLAKRFGFVAKSRFVYSLKGKSASQRRRFNYALTPRRGDGLPAERLAPGVILTSVDQTGSFKEFFARHGVPYTHTVILEPRF